jgi:8-oxo-dGTP diphosphatase
MAVSEYVASLRKHVGNGLVMLPSACAVVVDDGGRVLLGRRADTGNWSLPAGAIDPGEQPADAAVLEVYEETGVHIAVERLAGVALREVTYPHGDVCQFPVHRPSPGKLGGFPSRQLAVVPCFRS